MRKFLIPAVTVAALAATTAPALAQNWGPNYGNSLDARMANVDRRINMGVRSGALNYMEANRLRAEFNQIVRLEANYSRGGINAWERRDLVRRLDRISSMIRIERRDRDYGYGQNYNGGYSNGGYYGNRF